MNVFTIQVDHTRLVINSLEKLSNHLKSAEIYTPVHANNFKRFYRLYKSDLENIANEIRKLKILVKDNPLQVVRIDSVHNMIARQENVLNKKNIAEIINTNEGWRLDLLFQIHAKINEGSEAEEKLLEKRKEQLKKSTDQNRFFTIAFSVIALTLTSSTFIYNVVLMRKRQWLEGFLESVLNTSQNGIIHFKAIRHHGKIKNFKVEFANAAIEDQLGILPSKAIGRKLTDLHFVEEGSEEYQKFIQVTELGNPADFEIQYLENEKKSWFFVMLAKMEDGLTATLQNITEIRKYQDELTKNIQQLEISNSELEQYAYVASHDLQEPLRKIRTYGNYLEELQMNRLNEKGKMHLSKIIQSAERMSNLIADILNYSSLKREARFEPTDLNKVLANVLNDIDLTIEQKQASIVHDNLPAIDAIPLQVNQLFYNLITNALKFTKPGQQPNIIISSRLLSREETSKFKNLNQDKEYYEIVFSDNGLGFSPEFSKQIFELFKRLYDQKIYPGSGIGLSLCSKVVTNHNGEIFAFSEVGKGASFHVILPVTQ